jgi:hypothetical protein
MSKKDKQYFINLYEEEAEVNYNLYVSGKDDKAYERYKRLTDYVRTLRETK